MSEGADGDQEFAAGEVVMTETMMSLMTRL